MDKLNKHEKDKLFRIIADYRPDNTNKPDYYIYAHNKTEAKRKFKEYMSWMKIYVVEECGDELEKYISSPEQKYKYIVFNRK